jgi:hypothetical protein
VALKSKYGDMGYRAMPSSQGKLVLNGTKLVIEQKLDTQNLSLLNFWTNKSWGKNLGIFLP